ncbi:hypothetical protein LSAT2_001595 [Lamellibrachia satsuma]|nr:hypothetical protein LSAT2_001595 [Lamellibrachia satsuma]
MIQKKKSMTCSKMTRNRKPERGSNKKRHSLQELSEKAKWKRAKLDPLQLKTVTEIQAKLMQHDSNGQGTRKQKKKRNKKMAEDNEGDANDVKEPDSLEDDEDTGLGSSIDSCEDLRERLRAKIEMLQARRKNLTRDSGVEKKRLARKVSKMKLKLRRKTEKQNKVKGEAPAMKAATPTKSPATKPIFNKEGKMVFSKFDFTDANCGKKEKKGSDVLTGKNYKKLLEKVEKRKEKLTKVREMDGCGVARTLQKKQQWKSVLQKAEGVKVRDDPELLRKSLKKKEKLREKHSKEWKERLERVQKTKKEHQDKRKRNIQKKKHSRIDKKINRSKKKGHIIPGF